MRAHGRRERLDIAGMLLSGTCAVHCLIAALAPAIFMATGLGAFLDERTEWAFTALAVIVGAAAAVMAWRARRSRTVVAGFGLSILALVAGRGLEHFGVDGATGALAVTGGLGLALTHLLNLRAVRRASPETVLARRSCN